jgi:hypothetical protein
VVLTWWNRESRPAGSETAEHYEMQWSFGRRWIEEKQNGRTGVYIGWWIGIVERRGRGQLERDRERE